MPDSSYEKLVKNEDFITAVAVEIARSPRLKMLILEAIIKNVSTKEDIRELRHYIDVRIGDLDKRIDALDKRIDALDKRIDALDKRIDALEKRINMLQWVMLIFFSIFSVILSVLTFLIATLPR